MAISASEHARWRATIWSDIFHAIILFCASKKRKIFMACKRTINKINKCYVVFRQIKLFCTSLWFSCFSFIRRKTIMKRTDSSSATNYIYIDFVSFKWVLFVLINLWWVLPQFLRLLSMWIREKDRSFTTNLITLPWTSHFTPFSFLNQIGKIITF